MTSEGQFGCFYTYYTPAAIVSEEYDTDPRPGIREMKI
jgi:hypothetical protein